MKWENGVCFWFKGLVTPQRFWARSTNPHILRSKIYLVILKRKILNFVSSFFMKFGLDLKIWSDVVISLFDPNLVVHFVGLQTSCFVEPIFVFYFVFTSLFSFLWSNDAFVHDDNQSFYDGKEWNNIIFMKIFKIFDFVDFTVLLSFVEFCVFSKYGFGRVSCGLAPCLLIPGLKKLCFLCFFYLCFFL